MKFNWDEDKRAKNLRKHGIDFADVVDALQRDTLTYVDDRFPYTEQRFITIGLVRDTVVLIAHTETDEAIRIIHARKADSNTAARFFSWLGE